MNVPQTNITYLKSALERVVNSMLKDCANTNNDLTETSLNFNYIYINT